MATMLIVGQGYEDLRLFGVPLSLSPADGPGTRFGEWNDVELRIWWRLILEVQCLGWFLDRSKCLLDPARTTPETVGMTFSFANSGLCEANYFFCHTHYIDYL